LKIFLFTFYNVIQRFLGLARFKLYLRRSDVIKVIFGAGNTSLKGWFSTEKVFFDLLNINDYLKFFFHKKLDFVLIEHVLEHFELDEVRLIAKYLFEFTNTKCNLRIAVPDGFHPDIEYINYVKPGGYGPGEHKILLNYRSLSDIFQNVGFNYSVIEYWDEEGNFHSTYADDEKGAIFRSFKNDLRNLNGKPHYTSLIIDFYK